jgi:hypothetical protein
MSRMLDPAFYRTPGEAIAAPPEGFLCMSNPGCEDLLYGLKAGHLPVRL